jgi:hypothetical protein
MTATTAWVFDTEPTLWTVEPVCGSWLSRFATPTPPEKTIWPFTITAADTPGELDCAARRSRYNCAGAKAGGDEPVESAKLPVVANSHTTSTVDKGLIMFL